MPVTQGLLGDEEEKEIIPAITAGPGRKYDGFSAPIPADGFFGAGTYKQFDAVLAMYHDQGLSTL